ncbi:MAG: hypothetical protein E7058_06985 [Lentisphaerae bacterium]|nr:hypothetical protein [Lentisphaerota bacterium]
MQTLKRLVRFARIGEVASAAILLISLILTVYKIASVVYFEFYSPDKEYYEIFGMWFLPGAVMFFIAVGLADFSKHLDVDLLSKVGKDEFAKFLREQQKLSFFVVGCCILILILTVAAVFMFTVFVVDFDEHRLMGKLPCSLCLC